MKSLSTIIYLAAIAILGITLSCGGSNSAMGEEGNVTVGSAEGLKTSSDMNISPANMNAQDPVYRQNDTIPEKKDSIRQR